MKNRIVLICVYIGNFPWYFNFFLKSCGFNKSIDFIIFTDNSDKVVDHPQNVKIIDYDLKRFRLDAQKVLGFDIPISTGYKLCDFKPAYGRIFSQYIDGYNFWGHCDIDVIFGNIRAFITDDILASHEVVTVRHDYITGCFTLFKNAENTNNLFMQSKDYIKVLSSEINYCFDETNYAFDAFSKMQDFNNIHTEIESMTHVVRKKQNEGILNPYFDFHILEGLPDNVTWEEGTLLYKNEYEALLYHLLFFKDFGQICKETSIPNKFKINMTQIVWD